MGLMTNFFKQNTWRIGWVLVLVLASGGIISLVSWISQTQGRSTVVVEWDTASELDTAGYHVGRSDQIDGPFVRISQALIPAALDPSAGGRYSFTDSQVTSGHNYYYRLEIVEMDGSTSYSDPIEYRAGSTTNNVWLLLSLFLLLAGVIGVVILLTLFPLKILEKKG
jgi:hypothetical protein